MRWAALAPAYAIGSLGIYWCLDRLAWGVLECAVRTGAEEASMTGSAFALLGLACWRAGVAASLAWRGERTRAQSARQRNSRACAIRSRASAARVEQKTSERRERGDEVAELRRRLEKAKRRAFSAQEERAPLEARASALEAELRDREAECKRLRDDVAKLEGDVDGARRDTARLREEASHAVQERDKASRVVRIDPDEHRALAHRADAAEEEVRRLNAPDPRRRTRRDALPRSASARTAVSTW